MGFSKYKIFFITLATLATLGSCKPAPLNNPNDPFSEQSLKNNLFLYLLQQYLNAKEIAIPDAIAVMMNGQTLGNGIRVYRVDPDLGVTNEFVELTGPASTSAFPGEQPSRLAVPHKTRNILYVNGRLNRRISVLKYDDSRSLNLKNTTLGTYDDTSRPILTQVKDSNDFFLVTGGSSTNNDSIHKWTFEPDSENILESNTGNFPFGVACNPVSVKQIAKSTRFIVPNAVLNPNGIQMYDYSQGNLSLVGSRIPNANSLPIGDNLCVVNEKRWLYLTDSATSNPIKGYSFDLDGNFQLLPSSPFTPSTSYLSLNVDSFSRSSQMALSPSEQHIAIVYNTTTGGMLTILKIDDSVGSLSNSFSASVGNAPGAIHWDLSGRFVYLKSDTGGTTNNHQIEYFQVDSQGNAQRGINSPITVGPMLSTPRVSDITSIPIYRK